MGSIANPFDEKGGRPTGNKKPPELTPGASLV